MTWGRGMPWWESPGTRLAGFDSLTVPNERVLSAQYFLTSLPRCGAPLEEGGVRLTRCQQSHKTVDSDPSLRTSCLFRTQPWLFSGIWDNGQGGGEQGFKSPLFCTALLLPAQGKTPTRWETEAGLVQGGMGSSGSRVVG